MLIAISNPTPRRRARRAWWLPVKSYGLGVILRPTSYGEFRWEVILSMIARTLVIGIGRRP